jgi:hypothetical protein
MPRVDSDPHYVPGTGCRRLDVRLGFCVDVDVDVGDVEIDTESLLA